ncbi:MAG: hypothetical protein EXS32_07840 [Opitutus sp.]|nr:hypothetical protein [Opitutus sp.]
MRLLSLLRVGVVAGLLAAVLRAADPSANLGQIRAARVIGDVNAVSRANQSVTPLHNDDLLSQGYTVKTGVEASIVLVFSNGAAIRLGADTEVSIDEFLQEPFPGDELAMSKLEKEPTKSSTKLRLTHGELTGHVLSLRAGSTHTINTPVGAAGIRGTTFRHAYRLNPNGNAVFASATEEGDVSFTAIGGQTAAITAALEITGRVRPGRRGGGVQFTTHEITRRSKVIIEHHVNVMRAARARVIFRRVERVVGPTLRRDPLARRETTDDTKDINREEQERVKQDLEKQAKAAKEKVVKPAPVPKTPAKKKS